MNMERLVRPQTWHLALAFVSMLALGGWEQDGFPTAVAAKVSIGSDADRVKAAFCLRSNPKEDSPPSPSPPGDRFFPLDSSVFKGKKCQRSFATREMVASAEVMPCLFVAFSILLFPSDKTNSGYNLLETVKRRFNLNLHLKVGRQETARSSLLCLKNPLPKSKRQEKVIWKRGDGAKLSEAFFFAFCIGDFLKFYALLSSQVSCLFFPFCI